MANRNGCPDRCRHPRCSCGHCVKSHFLKDGTSINTAEEAYVCDHCPCEERADDMAVPKGFKRVNHAWDYA